jgi:competence protein ComGC
MGRTVRKGVKGKMRISCRGNDKGAALFTAVVFIVIFSLLFLSAVPYIQSLRRNARILKDKAVTEIMKGNDEVMKEYDVH